MEWLDTKNITASRFVETIKKKHKASFCEEHMLHNLSKSMHNNTIHNFKIEERRRKVASY